MARCNQPAPDCPSPTCLGYPGGKPCLCTSREGHSLPHDCHHHIWNYEISEEVKKDIEPTIRALREGLTITPSVSRGKEACITIAGAVGEGEAVRLSFYGDELGVIVDAIVTADTLFKRGSRVHPLISTAW